MVEAVVPVALPKPRIRPPAVEDVLTHASTVKLVGPVTEVFLHPQHPTTRRFVSESEQVDEGELHKDFEAVAGRIVRLTFLGADTYEPLLGRIARETGVDYNILSGRIDRIKDTPYGQLTVSLVGGDVQAAQAGFVAAGVHLEELRR